MSTLVLETDGRRGVIVGTREYNQWSRIDYPKPSKPLATISIPRRRKRSEKIIDEEDEAAADALTSMQAKEDR